MGSSSTAAHDPSTLARRGHFPSLRREELLGMFHALPMFQYEATGQG